MQVGCGGVDRANGLSAVNKKPLGQHSVIFVSASVSEDAKML